MSASEQEFSESSSNLESPQPRDSPYSSPSQQVPYLASAFSVITCGDDVTMHGDGKKPCLNILEQPQDHFRFRYKSEMVGTHGCLLGKSTLLSKTRTHPTVELVNYTGKAVIRVRLAHIDKDEEHPHKLLEDEEDREVSTIVPEQDSYKVGFAGMGIIHTAKKDVAALLLKKYMDRMDRQKSKNEHYNKDLRAYCENLAKTINLNIVRLRFSAHDMATDKEICPPVFSEPIHNMKSAATNDLKICRISRYSGKPRGGDDIFILVEKVNKKNIVIRFFELNEYGEEVWSANGNFLQSDVHHQFAIVFRTPTYRDTQITKDAKVYIELLRPSDGRTSERKEFVYKADQVFKPNKRRRVNSSYSSTDGSSSGSIKSMNEIPTAVEILSQSDRADAIPNIPVFQINIPHIPVAQAAVPGDLADALLYGAGGAGGAGVEAGAGLGAMLGAPNVPEPPVFSLNSAELERLVKYDPDMPSEDRRRLCETDWTEYMQSFGESLSDKTLGSMDFLRSSMQLVTDSGAGKVVIKEEPVSPSKLSSEDRKQTIADKARSGNDGYDAFYKAEDGNEVKQLVRDICGIIKNNAGYKKQDVRRKLERLFEMRLSNGDTFLHMALATGQPSLEHLTRLVAALRLPALLNLANLRRQTVLHLALVHDLPRLVPALLARGCDPAMADVEGNNAVHYAVVCGTCLKPLLEAIKRHNVKCDLNAYNNERQTALHLAAVYDSESSVRQLIAYGASYDARDQAGRTPLHLALYDDCYAAAAALVDLVAPSDIDLVDGAGNTALQIVCEKQEICNQKRTIVKMLLDKKADPLRHESSNVSAWRAARHKPALRDLFGALPDDDVKSEPEDEFESADEGEAGDVSSKSLAMHLQDMGETEAANIIRRYIE